MLVCKNAIKEKINVVHYSREELKRMSRDYELICPECEGRLVYCHGKIKTPYFRHFIETNCSLELLGETEEHRKGKLLLFALAERLFPDSYVDLEYKILETNQRADVIVIHPDGNKTVFEMQCSTISSEAWDERCKLYESIDIDHYWVAGKRLVSLLEYYQEDQANRYKLKNLAKEIYEKNKNLIYLDVESEIFHLLSDELLSGFVYENEYLFSTIVEATILTLFLKDNILTTTEIENWIKRQKEIEEEKRLRRELEDRRKAEQLKREQEIITKRQEEYIEIANKHLNVINKANVSFVRGKMTEKEKWLFDKLVKKHSFTIESFPGLFYIIVNYISLIKTPPHLWQLWIYDTFIYDLKGKGYDKLHFQTVFKRFKVMVSKGLFRVESSKIKDEHYSFAIWDYLHRLSEMGILTRLGSLDRNYYRVNINSVPRLPSRIENNWLSKGISLLETEDENHSPMGLNLTEDDIRDSVNVRESYKSIITKSVRPNTKRTANVSNVTEQRGSKVVSDPEKQRELIARILQLYNSDKNHILSDNGYQVAKILENELEEYSSLGKIRTNALNNLKVAIENQLGIDLG